MITYLERKELVPEGQEADFARIFYDPITETQDIKDLKILIPNGVTAKHYCKHPEYGACQIEIIS